MDEAWAENVKRKAVSDAFFIHRVKNACRYSQRGWPARRIIGITEWWENNATPGTFELDIGVRKVA
ncbi:phage tail protein I [Leclercia sp. W6]|uniref:phage tail protein I n=1 Tax=Leclercia sp. W6 TaxID=2282310 RepID=UPI00352ACD5D